MARPQKNNADYFSHDVGMRNHRKIKALRTKFGISWYAIWCMLLEHIAWCDFLQAKRDELEVEIVAGDFGVSVAEMKQVVDFCSRFDLLQIDAEILRCQWLTDRLQPLMEKRERERTRVSTAESPQSKVKKKKGKISQKWDIDPRSSSSWSKFIQPELKDVQEYMVQKWLSEKIAKIESEKFHFHYESNGRKVGKNKMKKWKWAVWWWISRMWQYASSAWPSNALHGDEIYDTNNRSSWT